MYVFRSEEDWAKNIPVRKGANKVIAPQVTSPQTPVSVLL